MVALEIITKNLGWDWLSDAGTRTQCLQKVLPLGRERANLPKISVHIFLPAYHYYYQEVPENEDIFVRLV
jgi:hypothetical protein